jgi:uncharacterized membrane protein
LASATALTNTTREGKLGSMKTALAQMLQQKAHLGVVACPVVLIAFACSTTPRDFGGSTDAGGAASGGQAGEPAAVSGSSGDGSTAAGTSTGGANPSGGSTTSPGGADGENGGAPTVGPCVDNDCQNDATCKASGPTYECACADGFSGERCEIDIDECASSPCQNGGECTDGVADYSCECPGAFAGKDCALTRFEALPVGFSVTDVSPDGSVVVGTSGNRAAKYLDGTLRDLGTYLGDSVSEGYGTSTNGQVIVGMSERTEVATGVTYRRAVRWNGSSITELPKPHPDANCSATDVSANGKVIVGSCVNSDSSQQVIVGWFDGAVQEIGFPAGTDWCYQPIVSDDGSTVFGSCSVTSNTLPLRWTAADGIVLLTSPNNCRMKGTLSSGLAAAGVCSSSGASAQAFEWTDESGVQIMTGAKLLDASSSYNAIADMSADGKFLFGGGTVASNTFAVRWDAARTPHRVLDLLIAAGGTSPVGWSLSEATTMSADGQTLVGRGTHGMNSQGWIVRLD